MEYKLGLGHLIGLAYAQQAAAEPLFLVGITERLEAIAAALERIAAGYEWQIERGDRV